MKPPVCPLCGAEHWPGGVHVVADNPPLAEQMFQETAESGYKMPPARRVEGSLCAVEGHSGPDRVPDRALRDSVKLRVSRQVRTLTVPKPEPKPPGFDRKAYNREYNREYMRKRRAIAKAERNAQRSVNPQSDPKADTSGNP